MNYGVIKPNDIANGDGVRVSLFVSGCTNHCKGCFQPQTWNFDYGNPFGKEQENFILKQLEKPYIAGLSLLGGEPFELENQKVLAPFVQKVKKLHPEKDIWAYTGFELEDLLEGGKRHSEDTDTLLENIHVLVTGPFIEDLKDITLSFRGSSNQQVLDLPKTLKENKAVLYPVKK